jgi:hypothetical protein
MRLTVSSLAFPGTRALGSTGVEITHRRAPHVGVAEPYSSIGSDVLEKKPKQSESLMTREYITQRCHGRHHFNAMCATFQLSERPL